MIGFMDLTECLKSMSLHKSKHLCNPAFRKEKAAYSINLQ